MMLSAILIVIFGIALLAVLMMRGTKAIRMLFLSALAVLFLGNFTVNFVDLNKDPAVATSAYATVSDYLETVSFDIEPKNKETQNQIGWEVSNEVQAMRKLSSHQSGPEYLSKLDLASDFFVYDSTTNTAIMAIKMPNGKCKLVGSRTLFIDEIPDKDNILRWMFDFKNMINAKTKHHKGISSGMPHQFILQKLQIQGSQLEVYFVGKGENFERLYKNKSGVLLKTNFSIEHMLDGGFDYLKALKSATVCR